MNSVETPEIWTLQRLLLWSTTYLEKKGVNAARYSAETLLAKVCDYQRRLDIYLHFDRPCTPEELQSFKHLLQRRTGGEPLAYITGEQNFLGLDFQVGPGVLIPRFDTETIAMEAVARLRLPCAPQQPAILDLCCGSGVLGITVAHMAGKPCQLTLADIDPAALEYAQRNASRHLGAGAWHVLPSDLFGAIRGTFDLILCNPPYLDQAHLSEREDEVRHEPLHALDGGRDGLDFYRALAKDFRHHLNPGGRMLLEAGYDQHQSLASLFGDTLEKPLFDEAKRFRGAVITPSETP